MINNLPATPIPLRIRKARVATFLGFMMIGALMYIWSTGVSVFRVQLGLTGELGDGNFGLIALGVGVGSATGALFVGRLLDTFGAKPVITVCALAYPLSIIPLGFVSGFWFALCFGVILGLLRGAMDTALNAHGVQVERFYQRSIMSGFHACYSLGGFLLGMVCSWLTGFYTDSVQVDFGLGVRARMSHGLKFQTVLEDRLCLFIPADHPLAGRRSVKLNELTDQPIILTGRDSSVRELVEQLFADAQLPLSPGLEANYMSTVLALVRQGLGVSLLPESADEGLNDLVKVPVDHPGVTRQIGLITRTGQAMAPAAQRFMEMLKSILIAAKGREHD